MSIQDHRETAKRLRSEAEAIAAELIAIAAERKALALPAVSGDKPAIKSLALLNSQHAELVSRNSLLMEAAAEADKLAEFGSRAATHREALAKRLEAEKIARKLLEFSAAIDDLFATLVEALESRRAQAMKLGGLGQGGRLARPTNPSGSAAFHGLASHIDMPRLDSRLRRSLIEADSALLENLLSQNEADEVGKVAA